MRFDKLALCVVFCASATLRPLLALAEPVPSGLQAEVTKVLKDKYNEPASAQVSFDSFRPTVNGAIVCGAVGARGSTQPFYFIKVNTTGALTGAVVHSDAERDMASMVCNG
jgi:hypothetical protein